MMAKKNLKLISENAKTREDGIENNNERCYEIYVEGNKLKGYREFKDNIHPEWVSKPSRDNEYATQGLCHAGENVLITSYDTNKKENSILDIIDSEGRRKQLYFDNQSHVGGIGYDENSGKIYVSNGGKVNIYDTEYIASLKNGDTLEKYTSFKVNDDALLDGEKLKASYLNVHDGQLLVGNFIRSDVSDAKNLKDYSATIPMLCRYNLTENGDPTLVQQVRIPYEQVQGLDVYNHNGKDYYLFSTSYGRTNDSKLIIATIENNQFETIGTLKMPCMAEQVSVTDDGKLGVVFESDCTKYFGATKEIGNVCYLNIDDIIKEKQKDYDQKYETVMSLKSDYPGFFREDGSISDFSSKILSHISKIDQDDLISLNDAVNLNDNIQGIPYNVPTTGPDFDLDDDF